MTENQNGSRWLILGTYTHPGTSKGIYVYSNNGDGTFENAGSAEVDNPSYVVADRDGCHIYAVTERGAPSYVNALSFDTETGRLENTNRTESTEEGFCNIVLSPDGKYALTANYSSGGVSVFSIGSYGSVGQEVQTISYDGCGPVAGRQEASHIHCVRYCRCGKYIFITDLGNDAIYRYNVSPGSKDYIDTTTLKVFKMAPGSGPRHFVFDEAGKFMYLANELSSSVSVFTYEKGEISEIQNISASRTGNGDGGDIKISPDGRHVYMSIRENGDDGLAIYSRDPHSGILSAIGYQPCAEHPRNIEFTPDGKYLLVGGMKANTIQVFRCNTDGTLDDTGNNIEVPMPTCIIFA